MVKRAVAGLVGLSRVTAVTALRRGLTIAVLKGVASQLEILTTTTPPTWIDTDGEVLDGEAPVDEAGNEIRGTHL